MGSGGRWLIQFLKFAVLLGNLKARPNFASRFLAAHQAKGQGRTGNRMRRIAQESCDANPQGRCC